MLLRVEDGDLYMQGLHSVITYKTSRKTGDPHAGKYLVAVRERSKDGSCTFVKTAYEH